MRIRQPDGDGGDAMRRADDFQLAAGVLPGDGRSRGLQDLNLARFRVRLGEATNREAPTRQQGHNKLLVHGKAFK